MRILFPIQTKAIAVDRILNEIEAHRTFPIRYPAVKTIFNLPYETQEEMSYWGFMWFHKEEEL